MTKVSVVIPCYNQGHFVDEAVDSVLAQTFADLEIVIVNDGSTDQETNRVLDAYDRPKTTVLRTDNHRLGGARNNGIRLAKGQYILPLDADDRIANSYVEKAVDVLESRGNVGIVYCEAEFFGAQTGKWDLPPYKFPDILLGNVIFCSGMFRKSDWESVGGYRTDLAVWEDYDFWLSIIELGREVYRIPEVLFYYRRHTGSMLMGTSNDQLVRPYAQIMRNHARLFADNTEFMAEQMLTLRHQVGHLTSTVASMRRSRFWKLRDRFHQLIALLGMARE
jgi:glycosyltransferase involved in cell wall biosynthesis